MSPAEPHQYLLGLGSNQRHHRFGSPRQVVAAALECLRKFDLVVRAVAPVIETSPIGPSARRFCNSVAVVEAPQGPQAILRIAKSIERAFGRRSGGELWRARVIDIDLVLWSGGIWVSEELAIPHPRFRERSFVLGPARHVVPAWRDPITGLTVEQLFARLTKARPATR